jgi:hypothetical protein
MECIKSYNWFQTFCTKKACPFYESTCSLGGLDEKPNNTKISKSWNFDIKGYKPKDLFFYHFNLAKKLCSMSLKCLALGAGDMCRNWSCQKNMFGCWIK